MAPFLCFFWLLWFSAAFELRKWKMGNGRERLAVTFVRTDVRRADVRNETGICGTGLGTTFEL